MNKYTSYLDEGTYEINDGVLSLTPAGFELIANKENVLMLDTRAPQVFKDGFIPDSISLGLDGPFDLWSRQLISDVKQPILIITDQDRELEAVSRLAGLGYQNIIGYLQGNVKAWKSEGRPLNSIESISPDEFKNRFEKSDINTIDVRKPNEYDVERVNGVDNYPLNTFDEEIGKLDETLDYHVFCGGGYRSMITASILKSKGFEAIDVAGGFKAIKVTGISLG